MAQLTAFAYRHRTSWLHALDARVKLAALLSLSTASLHARPSGLLAASTVAIWVFHQSRIPFHRAMVELRWFLVLVCLVWLARCATTPGDPFLAWNGLQLTHQGASAGAMVCWRWLLVVCLGLCLGASTRTADISAAVQWGLTPLLGKSASKVGLMIGLLMRCIELILSQAHQIAEAQRARAVENRKNPLYRMKMAVIPLVRGSFLRADQMATAIAARCYGESRTPHAWCFSRIDAIALWAIILLCVFMLLV